MAEHRSLSAKSCIQWGIVGPALPGRRCCYGSYQFPECFRHSHIYIVSPRSWAHRQPIQGPPITPCPALSLPILALLPTPSVIGGWPQPLWKKEFHLTTSLLHLNPNKKSMLRKTTLDLAGGRPVHGTENKHLCETRVRGKKVILSSRHPPSVPSEAHQKRKDLEGKVMEWNTYSPWPGDKTRGEELIRVVVSKSCYPWIGLPWILTEHSNESLKTSHFHFLKRQNFFLDRVHTYL